MQWSVDAFVRQYGLSADLVTRYIDLISEVGELGKVLLLGSDYGEHPFLTSSALTDELGDCLFSLLCLCSGAGVDAEAALRQSMEKYERRMKSTGDIGSGMRKQEN